MALLGDFRNSVEVNIHKTSILNLTLLLNNYMMKVQLIIEIRRNLYDYAG